MASTAAHESKKLSEIPRTKFRLEGGPRWGWKIAAFYFLAIHLGVAVMLAKSNFIELLDKKFGQAPLKEEFDGAYRQSASWLKRLDNNMLPGGILLLGDSHLHSLDLGSVTHHILNYAVSGETTERLLRRLPHWQAPDRSRGILLALGINDFQFRETGEIIDNFSELFEMLPARQPLAVSLVFPVDERVESRTTNLEVKRLNEAIGNFCQQRSRCKIIDAGSALSDKSGNLIERYHIGDGLHLSAAGYAIWRESLRPALEWIDG